jgi:hypothetical protein
MIAELFEGGITLHCSPEDRISIVVDKFTVHKTAWQLVSSVVPADIAMRKKYQKDVDLDCTPDYRIRLTVNNTTVYTTALTLLQMYEKGYGASEEQLDRYAPGGSWSHDVAEYLVQCRSYDEKTASFVTDKYLRVCKELDTNPTIAKLLRCADALKDGWHV